MKSVYICTQLWDADFTIIGVSLTTETPTLYLHIVGSIKMLLLVIG